MLHTGIKIVGTSLMFLFCCNLFAQRIASGRYHSIRACTDGSVWTCGLNGNGQLGDNTIITSNNLVQVVGPGGSGNLMGIVAVGAGWTHSIALRNDGTVWAWGNNIYGQLGDGTNNESHTPVQVLGLTNIVQIAGTWSSNLALRDDGTVWAWGLNQFGMLGDNTTNNSSVPIQVLGVGGVGNLQNIVQISTGSDHSMALASDGTVYTWGLNNNGQLGIGNTTDSRTPVIVPGITNSIDINGGWSHSMVVLNDSTVWAWGWNGFGQLGNNSTTNSSTPLQVLGAGGVGFLKEIISIDGGWTHSMALRKDGTVWTWGENSDGRLGDGTTNQALTAIQVVGPGGVGFLNNVRSISIGSASNFSMTVMNDGSTWSWGDNTWGQLGDGTNTQRNTPIQVPVGCIVLPIELITFSVEWADESSSSVNVNWQTQVEINNEYFHVERSTDAVHFEDIARIEGAGNSQKEIDYSYLDKNLPNVEDHEVKLFYRLRQTDYDGSYTYSHVEVLSKTEGIDIITLFPNPNFGKFEYIISSTVDSKVTIIITDYLGKKVRETNSEIAKGINNMEMNVDELSSGKYVIHVETENGQYSTSSRFIMQGE